jgi:integrase/recombinase XerD
MLDKFSTYLVEDGKSENTIKGYIQSVNGFLTWFDESKVVKFHQLHKENVKEYVSYLKTIKNSKPKTINTKLNALMKLNEFLVESKQQTDMVITKKDYVKVQQQYASLAKVELKDVEKFRQMILDHFEFGYQIRVQGYNKRNYAIVTLLAYAGLRISEALNLKMNDFNLVSRELIVDGKGSKTRTVYMNDKVKTALQSWLNAREKLGIENDNVFVSNRNKRMDRTTINKLFTDYSKKIEKDITPHDLRHFFCSHAISKGMSVHEVANQAGHSNIHTTLLYTNPTKNELINKMNQL